MQCCRLECEKIGVSKQTISNFENAKTKTNLMQYIAIRVVPDYEMHEHLENKILPNALFCLVSK